MLGELLGVALSRGLEPVDTPDIGKVVGQVADEGAAKERCSVVSVCHVGG